MKVVHIHRIASIGGSERHLLTLLPALAARGLDVSFVGRTIDFDRRGRCHARHDTADLEPRSGSAALGLALGAWRVAMPYTQAKVTGGAGSGDDHERRSA